MFILCCSIALNLHKFEKRRQNYTYFHRQPNIFVFFLHFHSIILFFLFAVSQILNDFAPESIKSSHLRMNSPTEFWKPRWPRYDAEATYEIFAIFPTFCGLALFCLDSFILFPLLYSCLYFTFWKPRVSPKHYLIFLKLVFLSKPADSSFWVSVRLSVNGLSLSEERYS